MSTYIAFFAFIFASYLGYGGLGRINDHDGYREGRNLLRVAGVFALVGVASVCIGLLATT